MSSQRIGLSLEAKVGLFLLLAAAILVAFILILGNFRMSPSYRYEISYTASGGLRPGAKVKIAGVPAGKVKAVRFLDGSKRDAKGNALWVAVGIEVDSEKALAITDGARFFVSSEGLLGEKYVEITPGDPANRQWEDGSQLVGEPVLELQLVTSQAMELMDSFREAIGSNGGTMEDVFKDAKESLAKTNRVLGTLEEQVPGLLEDSRSLVKRLDKAVASADEAVAQAKRMMDGEDGLEEGIRRASRIAKELEGKTGPMLDEVSLLVEEGRSLVAEGKGVAEHLDNLSAVAETELQRVSADGRRVMGQVSQILGQVDARRISEELVGSVGKLASSAADLSSRVEKVLGKTEGLLGNLDTVTRSVKEGRGTLGALLADRELYDDIRELILDLKKNPWKVLWKP